MAMRGVKAGAVLGVAVCGLAGSALGQTQTLQNDGLVGGGTAAVQMGFEDREIGAARFNPPANLFPLRVNRVQIFWKSFLGQSINNVQESINIYEHPFTSTGPRLVFRSDPPQLTDGALNEFNLENENIVFQTPTQITVGLEFADDGAPAAFGQIRGLNYASLVTDTDGCQIGLNPLFAIPGGWTDICAFGARGDVVIRIVVQRAAPACPGDWDGSGSIDFNDLLAYLNDFNAQAPRADVNQDGSVDFNDLLAFLNLYNAGC
jgi:hypothetical protein